MLHKDKLKVKLLNTVILRTNSYSCSFDSWFIDYATNVAPIVGSSTMAAAGSAGMAGNRELNAKGMEYDQIVAKSLIGALCLDQVVNGYLSEV